MGGQQSKVTSHDRAILEMKIQRDKLKQYQRKIVVVLQKETDIAKQCLAKGDKRRALLALRQKKYQQGLLEKTDDQLMTLEQLTSNIEFSLVEKDVVYGLAQGNKVLKDIHKELSIEKVEKIMDESADAVAYQEEISQMLGQRISNADEDAVLEEYKRLENEMVTPEIEHRSIMLKEKVVHFPDAPTKIPVNTSNVDEQQQEMEDEEEDSLDESSRESVRQHRQLEAQLAS